jgi:hypothetical protein
MSIIIENNVLINIKNKEVLTLLLTKSISFNVYIKYEDNGVSPKINFSNYSNMKINNIESDKFLLNNDLDIETYFKLIKEYCENMLKPTNKNLTKFIKSGKAFI